MSHQEIVHAITSSVFLVKDQSSCSGNIVFLLSGKGHASTRSLLSAYTACILTDAPSGSQESLPNGVHKEVTAKRQAEETKKSILDKPAANQSHLSSYAFQQLTAAGVPMQLLHQIQASPHSTSNGILTARDTLPARKSAEGSARDSCQLVGSPKGSDEGSCQPLGSSKVSPDPKTSSKADFRKAAHLLGKRQADILKRLTCLEEDEAQRREVAAVGNPEARLKWQILTPKLLVRSLAAVHAVQAHCPMLPCRLDVDSSDLLSCTALKRNGPCCFVKVFIIRFVAVCTQSQGGVGFSP